jgi:hypothetical protein
MMPAMRPWLLILMIALLPLRGWAGGALAGDVISHKLAASAVASPHHDCMGHAQPPAGIRDPVHPDAPDASACASCQVFSSAALAFASAVPGLTFFQPPRPLAAEARFASADRTPGFKPPIS